MPLRSLFTLCGKQRCTVAHALLSVAVAAVVASAQAQGIDFVDFADTGDLHLLGDAAQAGNQLRVAPALNGQAGAVWHTTKQSVSDAWETSFVFQGSEAGGGNGSDGFAFVIQNASLDALGGSGGALGYHTVPNSVAIEFDTYNNGEPSGNHISVQSLGTAPNSAEHNASLGHTSAIPNIQDGAVHTVKIIYTDGGLFVYMDDLVTPRLAVAMDLPNLLDLDAGAAWVGFTAGTGGGYQNHDILSWSFGSRTALGGPTIIIVEPEEDTTLLAGAVSVDVVVGMLDNPGGHWHWNLDAPFPASGPAGGANVFDTNSATITGLEAGSSYTLYAVPVDADHEIVGPQDSITFRVLGPGESPYILDDLPTVTDDGLIASWLMLHEPIRTGLSSVPAMMADLIDGERVLLPSANDVAPVLVGGGTHVWTRVNFVDMVDMGMLASFPSGNILNVPAWGGADNSTQYLVTYLRWDVSQSVTFRFGSDDASESYFNANRLHHFPTDGGWSHGNAGSETVQVVGGEWNVLTVGAHESGGSWSLSASVDPRPDSVDNTGQHASMVDFGAPVSLTALPRHAVGAEIAVTVTLPTTVTSLDALAAELTYSPVAGVLEFERIEVAGGLLHGADVTLNTSELGRVSWVANLPGVDGISGAGTLATVYFRAVGGEADIATVTLDSVQFSHALAEPIRAYVAADRVTLSFDCLPGDSTGDGILDVVDVTKVERIVARLDDVPPSACPDANQDGATNVLDVTSTERLVVGLPAVAPAPQASRIPAISVSTVSDRGDIVTLRVVVRGVLHDVDAASFDLIYPAADYELLALSPLGWGSDVSRLDNDAPGRAIRVLNAPGVGGVSLVGAVAEIALRRRAQDANSPIELHAHIGDTAGRSLLLRSFSIPMMRVPTVTAALPNFPNPFNPETWIPFDLAESSDVVIRVYGIDGTLVRTLDLGALPAGSYAERSSAAYWDGRNDIGEPVAGGVYHYEIRAGAYRATRRMVILK
jgi:hypothetical protein